MIPDRPNVEIVRVLMQDHCMQKWAWGNATARWLAYTQTQYTDTTKPT